MRRALCALALTLAVSGGGLGCKSEPSSASDNTAAAGVPQRIVSTMPNTTEMLWHFGVWQHVVGVSRFCDVPAEARELPVVGGGMDPDVERILALAPDLVVGTTRQRDFPFVRTLGDAGIAVFLIEDNTCPALRRHGAAGRARGRERCRAVGGGGQGSWPTARLVAGRQRPRVLLMYEDDPFFAAGPESYAHAGAVGGGENVDRR
jgi:iron complex transport system substrate-binding protein